MINEQKIHWDSLSRMASEMRNDSVKIVNSIYGGKLEP